MAFSANGSTAVHGVTPVGKLKDIDFSENGEAIDITGLDDVEQIWEDGTPDRECTINIIGETTLARGAKGDLTITWNSGGTSLLTDALLINKAVSGALNVTVATALTFKKGPA